jgi:hypothetical protein
LLLFAAMASTPATRARLHDDTLREVAEHAGWRALGPSHMRGIAQVLEHVGLMLLVPPGDEDVHVICPEGASLSGRITLVQRHLQIAVDGQSVIVDYWVPDHLMTETVRRIAMLMPS